MPDASHDPYVGRTLVGRYRLEKRIGVGGMGAVYQAEHVLMGKQVAVKVLHGDMARIPQAVARFEREARSLSKLSHPNLVNATDFGETDDGSLFMVMELCQGPSLAKLLKDEGRLDLQRAGRITQQILDAVEVAHDRGVIHRDLKPDNILLVEQGGNPEFVKILDFGIAKMLYADSEEEVLTRSGMVFGTPEYLSPEQGLGKGADHRSDLYAVAVILYEMLAGVRPFRAPDKMDLIAQHITATPEPLRTLVPEADIPPALDKVVLKGLSKKPKERHPSAKHFAETLRNALHQGVPSEADLGSHELMGTAVEAGRAVGTTLIRAFRPDFWRRVRRGELSIMKAAPSLSLGLLVIGALVTSAVLALVEPNRGAFDDDDGDGDEVATTTGSAMPFIPFLYDPIADARRLSEAGKHTKALVIIDDALHKHPANASLHVEKARLLDTLGRWREAAKSYAAAMRYDAELRDDPEILNAIVAHLGDRGADLSTARDLIETSAGASAVGLVAAKLDEAHARILEIRAKEEALAEEDKALSSEERKEAAAANHVRVSARRSLEALGGGGVDIVPYLIDEVRFVTRCPEMKGYVMKFGKLTDPRFVPVLKGIARKGYGASGHPCLKKVLPFVLKKLSR